MDRLRGTDTSIFRILNVLDVIIIEALPSSVDERQELEMYKYLLTTRRR